MSCPDSKRRRSITPSKRKSIHSHRNCILPCCCTMGRYGINKPQTSSTCQIEKALGADYDEVDNVLSKIQNLPISIDRNRRNSWSNDKLEPNSSESDIENLKIADHTLAKSVPAQLPSYLYYRDAADVETDNSQLYDDIENSSSRTKRENFYMPLIKQNERTVNQNYVKRTNNMRISRQDSHLKSFFVKFIGLILSPLNIKTIIVIIVLNIGASLMTFSANVYDETKFSKELTVIGEKYNIDSNAILKIKSGVLATFKKEDTVTYIFVYNSENQKNYEYLKNFVNEVANVSARYLRNNTEQNQHLVVRHDQLSMNEHGELVNEIREVFNDRGVVLFENLGKIPVHLVRAFHYYCDEFNPLAKKSAVLFTMDLHDCSIALDQEVSHLLLEKCLSKKWSSLNEDVLYPLLNRVIHIIVDLTKIY